MAGLELLHYLANQCKTLPPGVEIEVQKKISKKELEKIIKKV